ncbi:MAG: hypothetical protein LBQ61_10615, partial [Spirochaetales bacterium]|nr:hypothetical protein [Spirochaetales bacterium]
MRTGEAPAADLKTLFDKIKEFMQAVYETLTGRIAVKPDVKEFFDQLHRGELSSKNAAEKAAGAQAQKTTTTAQGTLTGASRTQPEGEGNRERYEANRKLNEERPLLDKNNGRGAPKPKQPSNDLDEVYRLVEESRTEFDAYVEALRDQYGGEIISRKELKARDRAERKITEDEGPENILDINGKTLVLDDIGAIIAVMEYLHGRDEVVRMKDRYKRPGPGNYRDTLINVRMSNGAIVELQLNTQQMLAAKEEMGGHLLYEIRDQVQAAYNKGIISQDVEEELTGYADSGMERLYHQAFEAALYSSHFSTSSLDITELLKPISTHFQESGTGAKVLSGKTLNKLEYLYAKGRSSQSRNLSPGSSNDGTTSLGSVLGEDLTNRNLGDSEAGASSLAISATSTPSITPIIGQNAGNVK